MKNYEGIDIRDNVKKNVLFVLIAERKTKDIPNIVNTPMVDGSAYYFLYLDLLQLQKKELISAQD
jgi:hypothetical protein